MIAKAVTKISTTTGSINSCTGRQKLTFLFCVLVLALAVFTWPTSSASAKSLRPDLPILQTSPADSPATNNATAGEENSTSKAVESGPSWWQVIFSGGPLGIMIIICLIGLSLCSVYLVFDQILTLRKTELMPEDLAQQVRESLLQGKSDQATTLCQAKPSTLSFVLLHGIEEIPFGWGSVEKSVEDALAEQSARLYRKTEYLSVIGNIAPMVGLLGTVLGMILAFHRVAESQGTANASDLAEGIYQALITTVGGLMVAIPSLGAFAIFRNRLDQLVAETAHMAQHVFSPLRSKRKTTSEKKNPKA